MEFHKATIQDIPKLNGLNQIGEFQWRKEFFSVEKPCSLVYFALQDGKAVGVEGFIEFRMNFKGRKLLTHRSERTKVALEHRGKGVFQTLVAYCDAEAIKKGSQMSWGATTALKPLQKAGFEAYTGFRSYIFFPVEHSIKSIISNILRNKRLLSPQNLYRTYKSRKIIDVKRFLSFLQLFRSTGRHQIDSLELRQFDMEAANQLVLQHTATTEVLSLSLQKPFFEWIYSKGKKYLSHSLWKDEVRVGHVLYYLNVKTLSIVVVDVFVTDATYLQGILRLLSRMYKNSIYPSVFLSLNYRNPIHRKWVDELKKTPAFVRTKAGSFILKNYTAQGFTIDNLLLTDLWLEL